MSHRVATKSDNESIIRWHSTAGMLVISFCAFLTACDDEIEKGRVETRSVVRALPERGRIWIDVHDRVDPDLWLASREAGHDLAPADPAVAATGHRLDAAAAVFMEKPRMLANRTVQLSAMLAEIGLAEAPSALLERLTAAQRQIGGRGLYGEMCQHYFNARSQGLPPERALAVRIERGRAGR